MSSSLIIAEKLQRFHTSFSTYWFIYNEWDIVEQEKFDQWKIILEGTVGQIQWVKTYTIHELKERKLKDFSEMPLKIFLEISAGKF